MTKNNMTRAEVLTEVIEFLKDYEWNDCPGSIDVELTKKRINAYVPVLQNILTSIEKQKKKGNKNG